MKRIGRFFCAIVYLLPLLALFSGSAFGQSPVSVEATVSETTIYTGERVSLSIEVSGNFNNISRPDLPEFEGFRLLSNNPSTSRSYRYVNGESSTSYTYSYYLIAQNKGSYQIPPINISIDGETRQTDPINVKIVNRNESAESSESETPNIFLQLEVSDKEPVAGQQIITDVILFFREGLEVNSFQPVPGWKAEGFWKEELENSSRPQATSTIVDGVRYRKAKLMQFALFPTKSSELEISPYKIIVSVRSTRSRDSPFSSFFGGFGNNQRQVELASDPIVINVRSLPSINGSDYLGAVGDFNISREISTSSATVGESIEITTHINGTGNIPLISKPEFELPDGLEIYEPQENSNLNRRNQKISGSKTFTDVIIARSPGSYTVPEKNVAHYNPSQDRYITQNLPALNFEIHENPNAVSASDIPSSFPVSPVTGLVSWDTPASVDFLTAWWFWVGIILPMVIIGVGYWQKSYIEKMNTDRAFARSKRASDRASDRLEDAISLSEKGNIKQAYNLLQKALTGFISDRLNLPEAGLSNEEYVKALKKQDIDENLIKNVRMLLEKCASISYAPDTSHAYLKSHVGLAQSTLDKLKKVL
jgi:hypothetical protein